MSYLRNFLCETDLYCNIISYLLLLYSIKRVFHRKFMKLLIYLAGTSSYGSDSWDWCHSFSCGHTVTEIWQPGKTSVATVSCCLKSPAVNQSHSLIFILGQSSSLFLSVCMEYLNRIFIQIYNVYIFIYNALPFCHPCAATTSPFCSVMIIIFYYKTWTSIINLLYINT